MNKKHWWAPALGVAALLVGLVAIPALAASGGAAPAAPAAPGTVPYCTGVGPAGARGGRGIGPMNDDIAAVLKMSVADLQAARQSGSSLAEIAAKQGISRDDLIAAMLKAHQAAVAAQVKAGNLTQAQADQILSLMKSRIEQQIDYKGVGPAAGRGGFGPGAGFGRGMMGGRGGRGPGFGRGAGSGAAPGSVQNSSVTNS